MFNATTGAEDLTDTSGMLRRNVVQHQREESLQALLRDLYPDDSSEVVENLSSQLLQILSGLSGIKDSGDAPCRWQAGDAVLISYADTVI